MNEFKDHFKRRLLSVADGTFDGVIVIIYDEARVSYGFFYFEAKQSSIRKTLTKSVYKVYMAINVQTCANVCIGHTVHEIACV